MFPLRVSYRGHLENTLAEAAAVIGEVEAEQGALALVFGAGAESLSLPHAFAPPHLPPPNVAQAPRRPRFAATR